MTVKQAAGQADPTNDSPVHFTGTFSEPVTGFGAAAVMLSGTAGASTATVTELPPNDGTTYDVAVSGMTSRWAGQLECWRGDDPGAAGSGGGSGDEAAPAVGD